MHVKMPSANPSLHKEELVLSFDLYPGEGLDLQFTYDDCAKVRSLSQLFASVSSTDAHQAFSALSEGGRITKAAFDAAIRRLAPTARNLQDDLRYYLSASLNAVWNQFLEMEGTTAMSSAGQPTIAVSELSVGFCMLCKGSKSDKLQFAWSLLDSDEDGNLSRRQLWQLIRSILVMLFALSESGSGAERRRQAATQQHGGAAQLRDAVDDVAVEAAQIFFAEAAGEESVNVSGFSHSSSKGGRFISFAAFGDVYNGGGYNLLPFLELLDAKKWPAAPQPAVPAPAPAAAPAESQQAAVTKPASSTAAVAASVPSQPPQAPLPPQQVVTASPASMLPAKTTAAPVTVPPPRIPAPPAAVPVKISQAPAPAPVAAVASQEAVAASSAPPPFSSPVLLTFPLLALEDEQVDEDDNVAGGEPQHVNLTVTSADATLYGSFIRSTGLGRLDGRDVLRVIIQEMTAATAGDDNQNATAGDIGVTIDIFTRAIANFLSLPVHGKHAEEVDDGDVDQYLPAPDPVTMRVIVTAMTNIHDVLAVANADTGADGSIASDADHPPPAPGIVDVVAALLPFTSGRKSDKLRFTWQLLDESEAGMDGLSRRQVWRALRSFLVTLLVMCRGKFVSGASVKLKTAAGNASGSSDASALDGVVPEPLDPEEAASLSLIADAAAVEVTTSIFHATASSRQAAAAAASRSSSAAAAAYPPISSVTLEEVGAWYNGGGYREAPWMELLDAGKWATGMDAAAAARGAAPPPVHSNAGGEVFQESELSMGDDAADSALIASTALPLGDQEAGAAVEKRQLPQEQAANDTDAASGEEDDDDVFVCGVSGAKVVLEFGSGSPDVPSSSSSSALSNAAGAITSPPPIWRFTAITCDLVRHISDVSGLKELTAPEVTRAIRKTVQAKMIALQQHQQHQAPNQGHGRYMVPRDMFNSCVRSLIPVQRLTRSDRHHLSRFLALLFDALDIAKAGVVDWREVAVALSLFAGKGGKSEKASHGFDLFRYSAAEAAAAAAGDEEAAAPSSAAGSRVTKDGLSRYLRAVFTSLAVVQELGGELDLSVQCMLAAAEAEGGALPSDVDPAGTGIPPSCKVALRSRGQRSDTILGAANNFTRHIFARIAAGDAAAREHTTTTTASSSSSSSSRRWITFEDLAALYNDDGGHTSMPFFELLSLRKWSSRGGNLSPPHLRMLLTYACARPLALAAQAHMAAREVAVLRMMQAADGGNASTTNTSTAASSVIDAPAAGAAAFPYDMHNASIADVEAAMDAIEEDLRQQEAALGGGKGSISGGADNRYHQQARQGGGGVSAGGSSEIGTRLAEQSGVDEGGVDGDYDDDGEDEEDDGEDRDADAAPRQQQHQHQQQAFKHPLPPSRPIFEFSLPTLLDEEEGEEGEGGGTTITLSLMAGDCAALHRVLLSSRLDTLDPDSMLQMLKATAAGGKQDGSDVITRRDFTSFASRLLPGPSSGIPLPDLQWVEAALQSIFTACDRQARGTATIADVGTAMLLLCTGSKSAKLAAAWSLFDDDADGVVQLQELYLLLRALLTSLYILKSWGRMPADAASPQAGEDVLTVSDRDDINACTIALGDAAYVGCLSVHVPGAADHKKHDGVSFSSFGAFYNALATSSSSSTTSSSSSYFMWLELLDLRKYPTPLQIAQHEHNAMVAMAAAAARGQQEEEEEEEEENQQEASDPEAAGYQRLPSDDGEDNDAGAEEGAEAATSSAPPSARPVYAFQLTSAGDTLAVTTSDLTTMQRISTVSPLARLSPEELFSVIAPHVSREGMLSAAAYSGIVQGVASTAEQWVTEAVPMDRKPAGNNDTNAADADAAVGFAARAAVRSAMRDCTSLRHLLLRLFDLFDNDGSGAVDVIEFLPALTLLTGGSKSSKLATAWGLRTGEGEGRGSLSRVELASFLACFLLAIHAMTSTGAGTGDGGEGGGALTSDEIRDVVVTSAGEAAEIAFASLGLLSSTAGDEDGVDDDDASVTMTYAQFASFYNGSAPGMASEGIAGFLLVPYLELLDAKKWSAASVEAGGAGAGAKAAATEEAAEEEHDEEEEEGGNDDEGDATSAPAPAAPPATTTAANPLDQDPVIYGFVLTSDASRLTLTRSDVTAFLSFVRASGMHRLRPETVMATILAQASQQGASAGVTTPQLRRSAFQDATLQLLESCLAERQRAGSIASTEGDFDEDDLARISADLESSSAKLDAVFDALSNRSTNTSDAVEVAAAVGLLMAGAGRKSEKLLAGWTAFGKAGDASSGGGGGGALSLSRPAFVSFVRCVLVGLMVFGHVDLQGPGSSSSSSTSGKAGHGILYLLATEAADEVAAKLFDDEESGESASSVSLDTFASFYNSSGWETLGFLELLDHGKWAGGSSSGEHQQQQVASTVAQPVSKHAVAPPAPPPAAAAAAVPVKATAVTSSTARPPPVPAPTTSALTNATLHHRMNGGGGGGGRGASSVQGVGSSSTVHGGRGGGGGLSPSRTNRTEDDDDNDTSTSAPGSGSASRRASMTNVDDDYTYQYQYDRGSSSRGGSSKRSRGSAGEEGGADDDDDDADTAEGGVDDGPSTSVSVAPSSQQHQQTSPDQWKGDEEMNNDGGIGSSASVAATAPESASAASSPRASTNQYFHHDEASSSSSSSFQFQFDLPGRHPLLVTGSDVHHLALVRQATGFPDLQPTAFVAALAEACFPGQGFGTPAVPSDSAGDGSSISQPSTLPGSTRVPLHSFLTALRSLIPASRFKDRRESEAVSQAMGRMFILMEQFQAVVDHHGREADGSSAEGHVGVPFCDLASALLFLCSGSKTEKLMAAFAAMDTDRDGALTVSQFTSLVKDLLLGLLAFRSDAHMESESHAERATEDHLLPITAHLAETVFRQATTTLGALTFPEFGTFYNGGGFVLMPFIELLDWRKMGGGLA